MLVEIDRALGRIEFKHNIEIIPFFRKAKAEKSLDYNSAQAVAANQKIHVALRRLAG